MNYYKILDELFKEFSLILNLMGFDINDIQESSLSYFVPINNPKNKYKIYFYLGLNVTIVIHIMESIYVYKVIKFKYNDHINDLMEFLSNWIPEIKTYLRNEKLKKLLIEKTE